VHRVVAAVDCGMTVNPQTIERQTGQIKSMVDEFASFARMFVL